MEANKKQLLMEKLREEYENELMAEAEEMEE